MTLVILDKYSPLGPLQNTPKNTFYGSDTLKKKILNPHFVAMMVREKFFSKTTFGESGGP